MKNNFLFPFVFLFVLFFCPAAGVADSDVIFSSSFNEINFADWTYANNKWQRDSGTDYLGERGKASISGAFKGESYLAKHVSTAGQSSVVLKYYYKIPAGKALETNDHIYLDWSADGGWTWQRFSEVDYTDTHTDGEWFFAEHILPVGAANNTNFAFRFVAVMDNGNDKFFLDNVLLEAGGQLLPGSLTVDLEIINDNGGALEPQGVNLYVDGDDYSEILPGSVAPRSFYPLTAGDYEVSYDSVVGYNVYYSGDCDGSGFVEVGSGQTKSCTVTYNDKGIILIVTKIVRNNNVGTKVVSDFSFTINGGEPIFFEVTGGYGTQGRKEVELNEGWYSIVEVPDPDYAATYKSDVADACNNMYISDGKDENGNKCDIINEYILGE